MNQTIEVETLEPWWAEEERALRRSLLSEPELEMVEPPQNPANRIERMYPLQWKHPREGEDPRVWLHGRATALKQSEFEEHFRQQISRMKLQRRD